MIERYQDDLIRKLFSDKTRFETMVKIEMEALAARYAIERRFTEEQLHAAQLLMSARGVRVESIRNIEEQCGHETEAVVRYIVETLEPTPVARWVHYGLTSSDITDTALVLLMRNALSHVMDLLSGAMVAFEEWQAVDGATGCVGYTHGQPAVPMQFGDRTQEWADELLYAYEKLSEADAKLGHCGRLAGPVGTYLFVSRDIESYTLSTLGLETHEHGATQIVPRARFVVYAEALATLLAVVETIALDLWLLCLTGEVRLASSPSSSMPQKRNPTELERLCGLARLARGYEMALLESVPTALERDISQSSVERVALPDLAHLAAYASRSLTAVARRCTLVPDRMTAGSGRPEIWAHHLQHEAIVRLELGRNAAASQVRALVDQAQSLEDLLAMEVTGPDGRSHKVGGLLKPYMEGGNHDGRDEEGHSRHPVG